MNRTSFRGGLVVLFAVVSAVWLVPGVAAEPAKADHAAAETIPAAHRLQPADLAQRLKAGEKPLILQVGSKLLFAQAHIPGAEYVGAAGQDAGLQALHDRVHALDRARPIVIYCGCCPWPKCPNIHRAYERLVGMGFTHVEVLYIAENFGTDWVDKGFPVEKSES